MGMHNEVFKKCPKCGGSGCGQVHQIRLGFGGFNLDDPDSLAHDLDEDELRELREAVNSTWFTCDKCGGAFQIASAVHLEKRKQLARELFGDLS